MSGIKPRALSDAGRRVQRVFADVAIVLPDAGVLMLRNVSLAALGNRAPRVARVILWSTALAFFTFSGFVALLR